MTDASSVPPGLDDVVGAKADTAAAPENVPAAPTVADAPGSVPATDGASPLVDGDKPSSSASPGPPGQLAGAAASPPGQLAAPPAPAESHASNGRTDVLASLPAQHRGMLRGYFWDMASNDWRAYYVGTLKSFSSKSGYGFLESAQAYTDWGVDVFIHKNFVPTPWKLGQPVEFAVMMNNRGQPQALDTAWLPLLPQHRQAAPHGVTLRAPLPAAAPVQAEGGEDEPSQDAETAEASPPVRPHRRLGTLKSYSPAQGYGFIASEEVSREFKRDTYFDKSQRPADGTERLGQTVEFSVTLNAREFPQARHIDWDPIPLLPPDPSKLPITRTQGAARNHRPETLDKVRQLLALLRDSQLETAIVSAIDYQGGSHATSGEDDIDFVTLVLDRLGPEKQAMGAIKDFVKMLLLLMLAKMLRKRVDGKRSQQLMRWLEALSVAIDASVEGVREHYQDVLVQIKNHLEAARRENSDLQEQLLTVTLKNVLKRLEDKAKAGVTPPEPAAAAALARAPGAAASDPASEPPSAGGEAQAPARLPEASNQA